jgi:hypothetical protein
MDSQNYWGALVLDLLLASFLQHREDESDDDECERDYEQVHPLPYFLPADLPKGPRCSLFPLWASCSSKKCSSSFMAPSSPTPMNPR